MKRYNLVLPDELFIELQKVADENNTTVADLLRRFIKLGFLANEIEKSPTKELVIRDGNTERVLLLM